MGRNKVQPFGLLHVEANAQAIAFFGYDIVPSSEQCLYYVVYMIVDNEVSSLFQLHVYFHARKIFFLNTAPREGFVSSSEGRQSWF